LKKEQSFDENERPWIWVCIQILTGSRRPIKNRYMGIQFRNTAAEEVLQADDRNHKNKTAAG
jgi:hypothetical protein